MTISCHYPAYKPSGVPWLGDVQEHWDVRRPGLLRKCVSATWISTPGRAKYQSGFVTTDVYKNDHIKQGIAFMGATASMDEIERFRLERGDVLITKDSETWDDIGVPPLVAESADDLICGYHLALLRPFKGILRAYLVRALQTNGVAYQFHLRANGVTRYGLTHKSIQSVRIPLPSLVEQATIVRYQDYADLRIRRYISAKQKHIALLEEEKQAIINRAVTRGLDTNVSLKPSGVEWLGDVPEHWEVRRLKTLCSMRSGEGITAESIETEGEYPVYGGNGLRGYTSNYSHDGAFVLIGRQGELCGNIHIARGQFWTSEHTVVATLGTGHDVNWFSSMLIAMNLNQYSIAAAQPGLSVEPVLNLLLPVPPKREQKYIANRIGESTSHIDAAIARARRQIGLVEEYRTRLIADVVTGKLDVRAAAGQLQEEPEKTGSNASQATALWRERESYEKQA